MRDELIWWALAAEIPPSRHIGADRARVVLITLVMHANANGVAWPAASTIAKAIGLSRWDVRNAFDALEAAGLIERVAEHVSRSAAWHMAGMPAIDMAGEVAGDVAGEVAGDVAGMPATNRREVKRKELGEFGDAAKNWDKWCARCGATLRPDRTCPNECERRDPA